jgi:hypothetical protein
VAAVLVPALFAICLYWPSRHGGLLADDLLLAGYAAEPSGDGFCASWPRVAADFTGPWAFTHGDYYRPLTTLSLALERALGGGAEWQVHTTNIALFAIAVAAFARFCGVLFGSLAALLGGLWLAAHPAAHESICWPCTRADLLVSIAAAAACTAMVRHLRGEPGRHRTWLFVACALALLAKETGVVLAIWLLALDLAIRGRAVALGTRLRLHLGLAALWVAYFAWRHHVLGDPLAAATTSPFINLPHWLGLQANKLLALLAPHGERLPASTPFAVGAALATVVAGGLVLRTQRRWLAVGLVWMLAALLPVHWLAVSPDQVNSRFVLAASFGVGLAIAAVLGSGTDPRWFRIGGMLLLGLAITDLTVASRNLQARYADAWQQMARLRAAVTDAGARTTVDRPLVMLTGLPRLRDIPFLQPMAAWALAEPPLARREAAFVSLGLALEPGVGPDLLAAEPGPWRAMWQQGALLCYWLDHGERGRLVEVPKLSEAPPVRFTAEPDGFTMASGTVWSIGGLQVFADSAFAGGKIVWRSPSGFAGVFALPPAQRANEGTNAWTSTADVADDAAFLMFGQLEGAPEFTIELQAATPARATELRSVPPPTPSPLASPLRGAPIAIADLVRRLPLGSVPGHADPDSLTAVLMNKALGCRVRVQPGQPLVLPPRAELELRELDRFARSDRVYYYLECTVKGRRWRSAIDWFTRVQTGRS